MTIDMTANSQARLTALLARNKLEGQVRKAIRERFEFTKSPKDRVRRTTVYAVAAPLVRGWHHNDVALMCRRLVEEAGGKAIHPYNARMFCRVRLRDLELVPGEGTTPAQMRRAWFHRLVKEGHDQEMENGKLREAPHFREYRAEINIAFFEAAAEDYWKRRKEIDIWGLYALEGKSVREIAAMTNMGRDAVHRVVQAMRREMESGQRDGDGDTDE